MEVLPLFYKKKVKKVIPLKLTQLYLILCMMAMGLNACLEKHHDGTQQKNIRTPGDSLFSIIWNSADSILLSAPKGELLLAGFPYMIHSRIYYLENISSQIKIFELNGQYISSFGGVGEAPGLAQAGYGEVFEAGDGVGVIDHIMSYISYFDDDGIFKKRVYLHQYQPHQPLWNSEIDGSHLALVEPPYYSGINTEQFFIPTRLYWEYLTPTPEREKDYLITKFNPKGKLLNSFANYPKKFQNRHLEHAQRHYIYVHQDYVYLSIEASPSIQVFSHDGQWIKNMGQAGKYEHIGEDPLLFETKYANDLWNHRFASTLYGEMFSPSGFPSSLFRFYRGKLRYQPDAIMDVWDKPLFMQYYYRDSLIEESPIDPRFKQYIGQDSKTRRILFRAKYEESDRGSCKIYFLTYLADIN